MWPVGGQYMNVKKLKLGKGKPKKMFDNFVDGKGPETGDSPSSWNNQGCNNGPPQKLQKHPAEKGSWHVGRLICEEAERRK